jgi:hypothetical protein
MPRETEVDLIMGRIYNRQKWLQEQSKDRHHPEAVRAIFKIRLDEIKQLIDIVEAE